MRQINIRINGTSCQQCVKAVREALRPLEGVHVARAEPCSAFVQFSADCHSVDEILDAIRNEGFSLSAHAADEEQVA